MATRPKNKDKKEKPATGWWSFTGEDEVFRAENPDQISRLYFPLANEAGLYSAITPQLHGNVTLGQHMFITPPVSTEDLHNARSGRNFWIQADSHSPWSVTRDGKCNVEAGALWHRMIRENKPLGLQADVLNFAPVSSDTLEIMVVQLTNISKKPIRITPTAAIPIFGRSADNLRDHRHVTSLLQRIHLLSNGVLVQPTMSFDERGHRDNQRVYAVLGFEENGAAPEGCFPTVASFIGEGGSFDAPRAVLEDLDPPELSGVQLQGREAMGALRFKSQRLAPGKTAAYVLLIGSAVDRKTAEGWVRTFSSLEKVQKALSENKTFWKSRLDRIQIRTDDNDFNRWTRWVTLQPILRKIFGNSFLPDFDYGRGGRGWRDLWQDCLALLLLEPGSVRELLLNNFAGVRMNGSNATIIGKKPGEFIADRNNISRVWMDHGVWPWITTELYLHQTGDLKFLQEDAPYFSDQGKAEHGTVLEHILAQHLAASANLGAHGNCRLLDADWNDGLDMARERGESIAFTAVYAGNLLRIAELLPVLKSKLGLNKLMLQNVLRGVDEVAAELRQKGEALARQVRENEWIKTSAGHAWFNGYYDNKGERVEGEFPSGVRMTLTGQVFPILSNVATDEQVENAFASAQRYLQDKKLGGFRLNTDFGATPPPLGRAFAFAYGEKENGAFFSHMVVMFAYGLYQRGFVTQGHEVLTSLYRMARNTDVSKIYPGIPEYFNGEGRGLYHYLTGSASWYLLTWVTQVLGVQGEWGDLVLAPKLMPEQFGKSGQVVAGVSFAGKRLNITYLNRAKTPYGKYRIESVLLHGRTHPIPTPSSSRIVIPRTTLTSLPADSLDITVSLS